MESIPGPAVIALLWFLVIAVGAAKLAGAASVRFGLPAVFGELLAGVILGPTVIDLMSHGPFAEPLVGTVAAALGQLGVILLMFVAGLETDLARLRAVGGAAAGAAAGGVVLPLVAGATFAAAQGRSWEEAVFVGVVLTATSVSISAQTLLDLGVLRSRAGSTILGAAVIDDVLAILVLSVVVAAVPAAGGSVLHHGLVPALADSLPLSPAVSRPLITLGLMSIYFALAILLGHRYLGSIVRQGGKLRVAQPALTAAVLVAFAYAALAEGLGQLAAITGSYLAGVLLGRTPSRTEIDRGIHPLVYSLFVPLFFVSVGLQSDARLVGGAPALLVGLLVLAVLGKVLGCGFGAWLGGVRGVEAYRVGVGMVSRGEVGLIIAAIGLGSGILGRELFSILVLVVLATTLLTPLLLRHAFTLGADSLRSGTLPRRRGLGVHESIVTPQDDQPDRPNLPADPWASAGQRRARRRDEV